MQLAKTSTRLAKLAEAKIPYISVLTDPTTGGTTASYAMLGDIHIAEPKALIGFAGPRVAEAIRAVALDIVGDGPLAPALRSRAAALGIAAAVEFAGALPADEVAAQLRRAWLLAAPSLTASDGDAEGLPNTVVEAAASGLPVIASDHSGIPEAVEDGRTGLLVPEGDVEGLAHTITGLLGAPDRRSDMARAARALAEERFDLVRQTELLEAIYDRVRGVSA